ncbi:putative RDD family membrane protein YckC [Streptomyces aurantiacus]|uniref:RDD family protein n=1 Tax=Streptomyces aurantiacus TaxID=47760 RepID=UPI00278FBF48|nr:RDD family protein [Streptomyces aurantiacus]MDQ0775009.1 putative RDD family membrane protein YckC [Streptomyces aurantiacus]
MSFGPPPPHDPYGQPQNPQQGHGGYPQQDQPPTYGYPQAPQGVPPQQGYAHPQQPGQQYPGYPDPHQQMYAGMPPFAHWGQRFLATLVDALVLMVAYLPVVIGVAIGADPVSTFLSLIGVVTVIGTMIWMLVQEGKTGQTIGKKALGIRLLREIDGRPLGVGMAFVRRLAHFLDSFACYLGWLWPLWDDKKQTFADKVCSSVVIKG